MPEKTLGGSGGVLPWKIFEKLHNAMTILGLFEQFLREYVIFLAPYFECFTNDAFCSHSFDYVAYDVI